MVGAVGIGDAFEAADRAHAHVLQQTVGDGQEGGMAARQFIRADVHQMHRGTGFGLAIGDELGNAPVVQALGGG